MNKNIKIIGIGLVAVLIIGLAIFNYALHGGERDLATEKVSFTVTSTSIIAEFGTNITAATQKYSDKAVAVSGTVTAVTDSIVTLENSIICNFKVPNNTININQKITVKGRFVGFDDLMGELKLDECALTKNESK